jgi:HK97 family phage prohead protease
MRNKHLARAFLLKSLKEDGTFTGYGSVWDVIDSYGDVVIKGAFANSLSQKMNTPQWPKMLWQHDTRQPIGTWTTLREDGTGLFCEGKLVLEVARAAEAHALLKAGALSGLSIGYDLVPGGYEYDQKRDAYVLKQLDLWEVSPVTFPANEAAQVDTVKAALDGGPREIERILREAGFSRSQAKGLMARGYDGLRDLREAEGEERETKSKAALERALNTLSAMRAGR